MNSPPEGSGNARENSRVDAAPPATVTAKDPPPTVYGGSGNDIIIGNDAVLNYAPISGTDGPTRLVSITPGTAPGNNHLYGGGGNDTINGGIGNDYIRGSAGNNILVGDNAYIHYNANQIVDHIESINRDQGGNNTIYGGPHDDILIGGPRDDSIDGGAGKDLVFANNALLDRTATLGDYRNPRFRVLSGTQIYSTASATAGQALIDPTQTFVDPRGPAWWADFQITLLDHDTSTPSTRFGNNYIAGGPGDKMIFGGLGNDTIQGHGSIDLQPQLYFWGADQQITINRLLTLADIQYNPGDPVDVARATRIIAQINSGRVGAWRFVPTASFANEIRTANNLPATWGINLSAMVTGYLFLRPSFENFDHFDANGNPVSVPGNDGSSYIEGGGGNDVIFGDGGQNDIIGGNSDLFSLTTPGQRPSGSNLIFGGAGTDISRNDPGDTSPGGHARDADMIISNNGDIFRLVGVTVAGQVLLAPAAGTGSVGGVNTFNGFLSFNYDNYTDGLPLAQQLKIIPRAAKLLDYTPGGPAFNATAAAQDIGGSTEIHGENGDNFIFGEKGNNWIYGGGQDNQIVGGYGTNWISGGAGNAAIIASDGRIFASRNGLAEPLNGVTAIPPSQLNMVISASGKAQMATINVAGQLKTTVDLEPFSQDTTWNGAAPEWQGGFTAPHQSDDIIFGGIGNDTVHGGYGDDAISGGEALPLSYLQTADANGNLTGIAESDYYQPYNPGNTLRFNPIDPSGTHPPRQVGRTGQFALYDEFDPRRKILLNADGTANKTGTGLPWFLDLNATDGPLDPNYPASANIHTSGNDNLFGDLGNNWIVGGTGTNHLYGGFGNDLLDVRASQDIHGGLNDQPNTAVSNSDLAYGGAGKDVLIADNTADRLIDWVGNFNTYIVSSTQWGMPTVSRTVQPQLPQFLYNLSASDGADQTRAADFPGADPARNGEPFGELGLVLQHDAAWRQQTGAPSDHPPGNLSGSKRVTIKAATFNAGKAPTMFVDSGTWTPSASYYQGAAAAGSDAVSLFDFDTWIPSYYEYQSTFKLMGSGQLKNAFLIFDYQGQNNFKYAGLDASQGLLRIGQRTAAGWIDGATLAYKVNLNTQYNPLLAVNGAVATLTLGSASLSYTFSGPLNTGLLGLGVNSAVATFTWVQVQQLSRVFTYQVTPTISSTGLSGFTVQSGQGSVSSSRYNLTPPAGDAALSTRPLNVASSSYVEYQATVNAPTNGTWAGVVFGYTNTNDFLFAAIVPGSNQVLLGHRNPAGWFVDAVATRTIAAGTSYTLLVALDNAPVGGGNPTVTVVFSGATALSFSYGFQMVGGPTQGSLQIGLLARNGSASFYSVSIRGDDPAYTGGGTPQLAATPPAIPLATVASLQTGQLEPIIAAAIQYWTALPAYRADVSLLERVPFEITPLPGLMIGQTIANTIVIDPTAAGFDWFVDLTPFDSSEFSTSAGQGQLQATPASPAYGRMDLLTVVMHEFGHVLGYEDIASGAHADDLMGTWLQTGVRRFPGQTQFVAALTLPRPAQFNPSHLDAAFAPLAARAPVVLPRDDVVLAEVARLLAVQPPAEQPGATTVSEQEPPNKGPSPRITQVDAVLAAYSAKAPLPRLAPAPANDFAPFPPLGDELVAEMARLWQKKD
jgi:Ca2+-binding RTX toxin-like protein